MGFIDWIKNLFDNGKTNTKIYATNLNKIKGEQTPLKVALKDTNGNNLINKDIIFNIVGKEYIRATDNQGIATLNINLNCGEYTCKLNFKEDDTYNSSNAYADITISPLIEANDLTMNQGDGSKFKATLTDINGSALSDTILRFGVLGKTYPRTTDDKGEATLNINLGQGNYTIETESYNVKKSNKITVNVKPVPPQPKCESPYKQTPLQLNPFAQVTDYSCGPHAMSNAYYNLTKIDVSERELMSACGTTTAGTSHQGLATGLAYLNRKYGTNITMEWKSFSDVGFDGLGKLMACEENTSVFWHELYRNTWGHYSLASEEHYIDKYFRIPNSLSGGYWENRGFSTQQQYWNGISQQSICVLRKK